LPAAWSDSGSDGGRTVAMVTARVRVPAMACVGGPAAGRGARRRRDLLRSSASRGAVTWKPLRPVEKFGTTDWPTDRHTDTHTAPECPARPTRPPPRVPSRATPAGSPTRPRCAPVVVAVVAARRLAALEDAAGVMGRAGQVRGRALEVAVSVADRRVDAHLGELGGEAHRLPRVRALALVRGVHRSRPRECEGWRPSATGRDARAGCAPGRRVTRRTPRCARPRRRRRRR
jgi:hypothetical protein